MALIITTITLLVVIALALIRAFAGPTVFDRILAGNLIGTKVVLIIAVMGFLFGRPDFLDVALTYALINFISVIGVLRFVEITRRSREEDKS
ncbi:monovalent cation/H+ antiporter complex subunit F [Pleionea sediminis]|uniref:monovalent cation/H+ antiporter complex subunit F n=1 Tax=Pleionea sediminis TaxID=2569479 RepID=UPI0011866247|nr:monovalent cation/H+ antiporter complex subunit F [Pleionea sediminis]